MKLRILWFTNIPSPYRVDFFNELGQYSDLTVLFEKRTSTERDRSWDDQRFINFNGVDLNGLRVAYDKALCLNFFKYLKLNEYDHIIISNLSTPTGILAIEYMKANNIPYILEGDGGFAKDGKGIKEAFKKHLIRGAKAYFSTSKSHDDYFFTYGANKKNIYRYPFSSLFEKNILKNILTDDEKQKIREKLNVKESKIILSVGRFIPAKGFDILIKACKYLNKDIGVYIIGGEITLEYLELTSELGLTNVHFLNHMSKSELSEYYKMADVFVLPTRGDAWGLVINEAMANGLPVVTTNKCGAGLELVKENENGFIIPPDNERALSENIDLILYYDDLRKNLARASLDKIKNYTIENMVKIHMEVLNEIAKKKSFF